MNHPTEILIPSTTGAGTYRLRRHDDGSFSCSCLAWRKQYSPVHLRTCKHLIQYLGREHELARAPDSFQGRTRHPRHPNNNSKREWPLALQPMTYHRLDGVTDHRLDGVVADHRLDGVDGSKSDPPDLKGWWASVKLNGFWARWQDGRLYTKTGRELHPPSRITQNLPPKDKHIILNGELVGGMSGPSQGLRRALGDHWDDPAITFWVFDWVPPQPKTFDERWKRLQELQRQYHFHLIPHQRIRHRDDLVRWQQRVAESGDEGLVLRDPDGLYEGGRRVRSTLKWKPWRTAVGRILGRETRKTRDVLLVQEIGPGPVGPDHMSLRLTVPRTYPAQIHDQVRFRYSGRNEHGRPEIPVLVTV